MAAGAIPPPLFFERCRAFRAYLAPARHSPENTGTHISVDCEFAAPGQASPASRGRYLSKDF